MAHEPSKTAASKSLSAAALRLLAIPSERVSNRSRGLNRREPEERKLGSSNFESREALFPELLKRKFKVEFRALQRRSALACGAEELLTAVRQFPRAGILTGRYASHSAEAKNGCAIRRRSQRLSRKRDFLDTSSVCRPVHNCVRYFINSTTCPNATLTSEREFR
jgi:hypothetical protein